MNLGIGEVVTALPAGKPDPVASRNDSLRCCSVDKQHSGYSRCTIEDSLRWIRQHRVRTDCTSASLDSTVPLRTHRTNTSIRRPTQNRPISSHRRGTEDASWRRSCTPCRRRRGNAAGPGVSRGSPIHHFSPETGRRYRLGGDMYRRRPRRPYRRCSRRRRCRAC